MPLVYFKLFNFKMLKLLGLVLAVTCVLAPNAFASVYKCTEDGKISYQDTNCENGIETITPVPSAASAPSANTEPALAPASAENSTSTSPPSPTPGLSQEQIQQIVNSLPKSSK